MLFFLNCYLYYIPITDIRKSQPTELVWVSLSDRRTIQKLILVYKEKQGQLPIYLHEIFPTTVKNSNPYNLRNNDDFQSIIRRTEIYS